MGIQLYLKNTVNSKGTSAVFIFAQHKGKVFKKNIGVNVSPVEWNKKTYQVKNISIPSIAINKKLQAAESQPPAMKGEGSNAKGEKKIDLRSYPNGLYIVNIRSNNTAITHSIIKE